MNSAHIYRPLVETAGATLEHVDAAGTVKPEHYQRDARYLPGCFMSTEYLGDRIKANHRQVFRMLTEVEMLAEGRRQNAAKNSGLYDRLQAHFAHRAELNSGSRV